ncbi:oligosaccharide flippase family protein [Devosia limi]|nr:oligosaccharide flippase family protein [Devosia limi]
MRGDGLFARALRGSAWTGSGHIAAQIIRLASNLVLTRLLYPEAFGLMSLVTVLMIGVTMLSDVGIGVSVVQNKRGDERDFLDTAWTIQVLRGALLWLLLCALAWPLAQVYSEPALIYFLPVAGLSVLIAGFNPMRLETAGRHLLLGRVTALDLISQVSGTLITILLAWLTGSVWALVLGQVIGAIIKLTLAYLMIPGEPSRFHIEPTSAREIVQFGKWIIPSTAFGFMLAQGDRVILGIYLTLEMLGVYNIGQFLAAAPVVLASAITGRVLIPVYREFANRRDAGTARKMRLLRFFLTGSVMAMVLVLAFVSTPLVRFLYDPRYADAAVIIVLVAVSSLPRVLGLTYDQGALAAGDSRRYFLVTAFRGIVQVSAFVIGAELAGIVGALVAQGAASIIGHFSLIWLARKHQVWDLQHDLIFGALAAIFGALAIYTNWDLLHSFVVSQAAIAH